MTNFGLSAVVDGDGHALAVYQDEKVRPLSELLPGEDVPTSILTMLPDWDSWVSRIETAVAADDPSTWLTEADFTFAAPVYDAPAIYHAGSNFFDHVREMGFEPGDKSEEPLFHFPIGANTLNGHRQPVLHPNVEQFDWEVELVAVIGRTARRVKAEDALDHVAGYMVANDLSVRDPSIFHPIFGVRWVMAKGQETMNPMGPAMVPAKFIEDPQRLGLEMLVNNEVRQKSNTKQMIWSVAEQVEVLSAFVTLPAGTLLLTGTPAGTAAAHGTYLQVGDKMRASVEGLGTLKSHIVAAG